MVRVLLMAIFFLNFAAYAHGQEETRIGCEGALEPQERLRQRMYGFLKKLTDEIDQRYPAHRYYRVGVGRASGPIVASLRESGKQAASLPVHMNFSSLLPPEERARFYTILQHYLPPAEELKGKSLVLLVYEEDPRLLIGFEAQLIMYLAERHFPVGNTHVQYITRQDYRDWTESVLRLSFSRDGQRFHLRSLAYANEVRHWLHDILRDDYPSPHEFPMNDVLGDHPLKLELRPRPEFTGLILDLHKLAPPRR